MLIGAVIIAAVIFIKTDTQIEISQDSVILAFGDSLTEGFGAKDSESYPVKLGEILNMRIINAGISGEDSNKGLLRLASLLEKIKPRIVILCHGGNDILRKYDLKKTKENLSEMIALIKNKNADIIFVGVPNLNGFFISTDEIYNELADEYDLIYDSDTLAQIIKSPTLKSDQIHPNAAGYDLLAQNLAKLFNDRFKIINR
ncbi:MAG: GDSL-type esterase/lipase family protein [Campylobacteraceae bacterium]|nr:GDSL-type esterase/lipase family protein [Campylobacteraceae bacterium]